jgi:decaprenylphospho-beta-D-erythro-pentofuranosid-2-ulose 2-reductase
MNSCLILGSNSDVGQAIAYQFAKNGFSILLATRNVNEYQKRLAADITIRHKVPCNNIHFDADQHDKHENVVNELPQLPDVAISVFGYLGSQEKAVIDFSETAQIINANYTGHVSILNLLSRKMKDRKSGTIIGISSVAAERGRQSNYIYGSAKAGFTAYLSGLRNELQAHNVHVMTVMPGFIKTKMIAELKTPKSLTASPTDVSERIWSAFKKQKNNIYVLPIWKYIMLIIKLIPEPIFKKMKL